MHTYDFRCKACGERFSLNFKTYADYDAAQPACTRCGSTSVSRIIGRVAVKAPTRDYTRLSSGEMLNVFESGDSRAVGEMFQQIGGTSPELGKEYHDATQKLLSGESMDKVERDLVSSRGASEAPAASPPAASTTTPPKTSAGGQ